MARVKNTRQRAAIDDVLERSSAFRSAQELYDDLRASGVRIGLATVYRTLQAMVIEGKIDVVRGEEGGSLFRRCSTDAHHHHIVCRSCGFSVEIDNSDVEKWADSVAHTHHFVQVSHDLEIFGRCKDCAGR